MRRDARWFNALMMVSMIIMGSVRLFDERLGYTTRNGLVTLLFMGLALAFAYRWGAAAQSHRSAAKDERR
jgi:hypothetical protein